MKAGRAVRVIQTKRKPPLWSIKVGARLLISFYGSNARDEAINFAKLKFKEFEISERPEPKRERQSRQRRGAATDSPS